MQKIWIDLDNTPHVPFFLPIIRELTRKGYDVILTARDAFQVCDLADKKGLDYRRVGRHYGKNPVIKVAGLAWRSVQLLPFCLRQRPNLALSHGARSQNLIANLLGIPTIVIADYEHTRTVPLAHPRWTIIPECISPQGLHSNIDHVLFYRGIKEDVYVPDFSPEPSLRAELGIKDGGIVVTVRPPANEAHYYRQESDELFIELMSRIIQTDDIQAVLLPRNKAQEESLRKNHPDWFADSRTIVPARAVDGLNLIWISDLVVSGGGTMNREAAALSVPVYSIFRGKAGAVDLMLEREGRLTMIRSAEEVWSKIRLVRRGTRDLPGNQARHALQDILKHVESIARIEGGSGEAGDSRCCC